MSDLAQNHKRIWLAPRCQVDERSWCEDQIDCDECDEKAVEYIRADIVRALVGDERLAVALKTANRV